MEILYDILVSAFIGAGCFFALTGGIGILKMPDFYSRLHPAGKADTLAQTLIITGVLLQSFREESFGIQAGVKLILIVLLLFITTPTATHAITRAAYVDGLKHWTKEDKAGV